MESPAERLRRKGKPRYWPFVLGGLVLAAMVTGGMAVLHLVLPVATGVLDRVAAVAAVGDPDRRAVTAWIEKNAHDPRGVEIVEWKPLGGLRGAEVYHDRGIPQFEPQLSFHWQPAEGEGDAFEVRYRSRNAVGALMLSNSAFILHDGVVVAEIPRERFRGTHEAAVIKQRYQDQHDRALGEFLDLVPPDHEPDGLPELELP